jgi:molybdate transport system substrate-binding protein
MARVALVAIITLLAVNAQEKPALVVWSAGAVEEGVLRLTAQYERETGVDISTHFGTGPQLEKRLGTSESADVLIAPGGLVQRALESGRLVKGSETAVGRVGVGVTVRRGASQPKVSSVDDLKQALLSADSVVYNRASTGQYLETLFGRLQVSDTVAAKATRYDSAAQVLEHLIAGRGKEIGFGPITEIKSFEPKGVVLVGPLPDDVQNYTTYLAAIMSTAPARGEGDRFIRYLTSEAARRTFAATGVQWLD